MAMDDGSIVSRKKRQQQGGRKSVIERHMTL